MSGPLIAATVIGSWSFPGWYEKFIADVAAHPERFGPVDREEALRDAVPAGDRRPAPRGARPDHRRRDAAGRLQPGLLRIPRRPRADPPGPPLGTPGARPARAVPLRRPRSRPPDGLGTGRGVPPAPRADRRPRSRCPSPARSRWPAASTGGEVYADRDAVTEALIPIVNAELKALRRRRGRLPPARRAELRLPPRRRPSASSTSSPARSRGWRLHQHAHVLRQLPRPGRGLAVVSRRCSRTSAGRKVNQLALEFASREMAEVELLAELPETMDVAVGLVDVKNTWIEPAGARRRAARDVVSSPPGTSRSRPTAGSRRRPGISRGEGEDLAEGRIVRREMAKAMVDGVRDAESGRLGDAIRAVVSRLRTRSGSYRSDDRHDWRLYPRMIRESRAASSRPDRACAPGSRTDRRDERPPRPGSLAVWWLGQSGFVIKSRSGHDGRSTRTSPST